MREKGRERNTGFDWQRPDVILGLRGINIGINNQLIDKPEVIQHGGEYLQMEYPNNEESGSTGQRSYSGFSTQLVFAKKKHTLYPYRWASRQVVRLRCIQQTKHRWR